MSATNGAEGWRKTLRMRSEGDRARLRRAKDVFDPGVWKESVEGVVERRGYRRGTHSNRAYRGQVRAPEQLVFAQHHSHHRRHGADCGAAVAADRIDEAGGGEPWQQYD